MLVGDFSHLQLNGSVLNRFGVWDECRDTVEIRSSFEMAEDVLLPSMGSHQLGDGGLYIMVRLYGVLG